MIEREPWRRRRSTPAPLRGDEHYRRALRAPHARRHSFEGYWVAQPYLPDVHKDRRFYNPSDQGYEAEIKARGEKRRSAGED
ncbi:MAG: hypothetical protein U0768_19495 [Anaerolineae bacterium]